jgi:hypothetical protein
MLPHILWCLSGQTRDSDPHAVCQFTSCRSTIITIHQFTYLQSGGSDSSVAMRQALALVAMRGVSENWNRQVTAPTFQTQSLSHTARLLWQNRVWPGESTFSVLANFVWTAAILGNMIPKSFSWSAGPSAVVSLKEVFLNRPTGQNEESTIFKGTSALIYPDDTHTYMHLRHVTRPDIKDDILGSFSTATYRHYCLTLRIVCYDLYKTLLCALLLKKIKHYRYI